MWDYRYVHNLDDAISLVPPPLPATQPDSVPHSLLSIPRDRAALDALDADLFEGKSDTLEAAFETTDGPIKPLGGLFE